MKYTSILEKLACVFDLATTSVIYPIFIGVLILLLILFLLKKIKNKKTIVLMLISYLVLFIVVISNNYQSLGKVFDDISTNLFTNIYFPSTYTYLFTLLVLYITTIASILNIKTEKIYKTINLICFFVTNFILALIMDTVAKNNIDIFSKESLFTNTDLVMLLELSINIFIVWLLSLVVAYVTNKLTERISMRIESRKLEKLPISNNLVVENTITEEELVNEYLNETNNVVEELPNTSVIEENIYNFNTLNIMTKNEIIENENIIKTIKQDELSKSDTNILFEKLLNNGLPLIKEEKEEIIPVTKIEQVIETKKEEIVEEKDTYTLNDYRIFNKILKDIKNNNNGNIINIDRDLERRIITKYPIEEYNLFKGMLKNYSN